MADGGEHDWLNHPVDITLFPNVRAQSRTVRHLTLRSLASDVARLTDIHDKKELPLLSGATFGNIRTSDNAHRSDENVQGLNAIVGDYDGEQIPMETGAELLRTAGIAALLYASPSWTPEKPRWRVVCPCSETMPPDEHHRMLGRINGALGGILARESWNLSLSYFYGRLADSPPCEPILVNEIPIDLLVELDAITVGRPAVKTQPKLNGEDYDYSRERLDIDAAMAAIVAGEGAHHAAMSLAGLWAWEGASAAEIASELLALYEQRPDAKRDKGWREHVKAIPRMAVYVRRKEDAKRVVSLPKPIEPQYPETVRSAGEGRVWLRAVSVREIRLRKNWHKSQADSKGETHGPGTTHRHHQ